MKHSAPSTALVSRSPSAPAARHGFTLVELLVVISIVSLLLSMLLPAVVLVRRQALTLVCGNNQRQLVMGFLAYANDNDDLPTTYQPGWSRAWNWGDEGCGQIDSTRGPSGGAYGVNLADGTPAPVSTLDTPFSLAWDGGFVTPAQKVCQKRRPPYGATWFPWYMPNNYFYNGPGAQAGNIGNNSQMSGLFTLGGYRFDGATNGFSMRGTNKAGAARTAVVVCPQILSADQLKVGEPHSAERWTPIVAVGGYGNGQDDWGAPTYWSSPYDRNVTFGDGHLKHIVGTRERMKDR